MDDIARLQKEYENRKHRLAGSNLYSLFNPSHLFATHQRQRVTLTTLQENGIIDLADMKIFELGCGDGDVLLEFLNFGAMPCNIYGIDLLAKRLTQAYAKLPASHFINADGQKIPFHSHLFDLIIQFTALSSCLDSNIRQQLAHEMLRVLKPSGFILWYDFWLNPTNPQTRGIRPAEIKRLFPNCAFEFHKITLAPPIARRIVPVSWSLALFLESIKIFNSHYLVAIKPQG